MQLDLDYRKNNWNNSLRNSIVLHILLLLLALFFRMESDPNKDIDTQYAVTVSFDQVEFRNSKSSNSTKSRSSEGAQRNKSDALKKIESPKPVQINVPKPTPSQPKPKPTPPVESPQPTEPVISETTTDESDVQAVEEPVDVETPEPEYIPEESTEPVPQDDPVILNPELPSLDDIIGDINDDPIETEQTDVPAEESGQGDETSTANGSGTDDPSLKDGDGGSGRGNQGDGKGSDSSGDDDDSGMGSGGIGEGEYDDSGDGIFGRKVIYRDPSMISIASGKTGKLVFDICINRRGVVSTVQINEYLTTIKDTKVLRQALASMAKYKYEADVTAAREQCGRFTVSVDNFQGVK